MNFVVNYAYQKLGAAALPEDERWGFGKMKINTDKVPETEEEKLEVARTIGLEAGYEVVAIQSITPLEEAIAEGDIILEGEIVDDSK
jgi:hypothetical protein